VAYRQTTPRCWTRGTARTPASAIGEERQHDPAVQRTALHAFLRAMGERAWRATPVVKKELGMAETYNLTSWNCYV